MKAIWRVSGWFVLIILFSALFVMSCTVGGGDDDDDNGGTGDDDDDTSDDDDDTGDDDDDTGDECAQDQCDIGGICYDSGDVNPDHDCQFCNVSLSTEQWSFLPDSYECRASAGVCDVAEFCTGVSSDCPADTFEFATVECSPAAGDCDAPEFCTGSSVDCPADELEPATTTCRESTGECDPKETCTGASVDCPADDFLPDTTACDELYCMENQTCASGVCQGGTARNCGDAVGCTDDSCDEVNDECDHVTNDAHCADNVDCTNDYCHLMTGCHNIPDDTNCDNGLYCDGAETCHTVSDCQDGTPPDCPDNGIFCDGEEYCDEVGDECGQTGNPCIEDEGCNEQYNVCVPDGFAYIPAGTFQMGCVVGDTDCEDDESPRHEVSLDPFFIMTYEVTQDEYLAIAGENPSYFTACGGDCPVEVVNWYEAKGYCEDIGMRLPTEAEWEYAARGGVDGEIRHGVIGEVAWYEANADTSTHTVGMRDPNDFGLYDMLGNVAEWCGDRYGESYYSVSPSSNPPGPDSGLYRVIRGGGWTNSASQVRTSNRSNMSTGGWNNVTGFRCAGDVE